MNKEFETDPCYIRVYKHGKFIMAFSFERTSADIIATEILKIRSEFEGDL